ncbi:MAG: M81 family metallopeptidase [Armatimonadetes bacterium]|nr:M81 family metallopeptidase [Armatimonadota bacterium]
MKRIAVGGLWHESNSFAPTPTRMGDFESLNLSYGPDLIERWQGRESEIDGFLRGAAGQPWEIVPILSASAWPAGPVQDEVFAFFREEFRQRLAAAMPVDGVLLALHGAMITESLHDPDGALLREIRKIVGSTVPVVCTLDFHANISSLMVEQADALIGYDTYPHIDFRERGEEAAGVLARILSGAIRPTMALVKPPLMPAPLKQHTGSSPMREIMAMLRHMEEEPKVISISAFPGFAYSDVQDAGFSVVAVTDNAPRKAQRIADTIASAVWEKRADFVAELPDAAEAARQAIGEPEGPVILVDIGDNIGGGTPGDGTALLSELLRQKAEGALVVLADPDAVAWAIGAGVRQELEITVGGKSDRLHGDPVSVRGYIRLISDGIFTNRGKMREGIREDQGRTAVLEVSGLTLVLTEHKMPPWNLQQLRSIGIEPSLQKIIAVKAAIAYRAAYEPIARRIIEADTPGLTAANLNRFPYRHVRRPIYPLDEI